MWFRIIANICFMIIAISIPLWITILLFTAFALFFIKPLEIVLYGVLLDIVFYTQASSMKIPFYTLGAVLLYLAFETLRPRLRNKNI